MFGAQSGPADSYIGASYLSAALGAGTIDNWLITPELTLGGATHLSFFTRTQTAPGLNDMLEVRFSAGAGTATSGFTTLLTTIGGPSAYPGSWQEITANLMLPGSGRFAFRYLGDAAAANYIGIDTVSVIGRAGAVGLADARPRPRAAAAAAPQAAHLNPTTERDRTMSSSTSMALAALLAAGAFSLPAAASADQQEGMVVVRDAHTGQLRNATPAEVKALRAQQTRAAAWSGRESRRAAVTVRANGTMQKHLGESRMVYSVVSRDADGKLGMQCVNGEDAANAALAHPAPATQQEHRP